MKLYSTRDRKNIVGLKTAVMEAYPMDRGLYMPVEINTLNPHFFKEMMGLSFKEIAFRVGHHLIGNAIPGSALENIIDAGLNFEVPFVRLDERIHFLELFHGPSLAFKDFGARFMAGLMAYFLRYESRETTILVATSGDTGGAVASGFYKTPGVNVIILYPSGKVSGLQEKQLTTLGHNITAVEVRGTFDDCQRMVKEAFVDEDLGKKYNFSSANSINIGRLIPQCFYYFEGFKHFDGDRGVVFSVPSGNFGNLCAGLIAKKMGLPVARFIAATNINKIVPDYLLTGAFNPRVSIQTLSNAMDVGNPSNFSRIMALYNHDWSAVTQHLTGFFFSDEETLAAIRELYASFNYIAEPHSAIGYLGARQFTEKYKHENHDLVILGTAHPCKFLPVVEPALNREIDIPESIKPIMNKEKLATDLGTSYNDFKEWLLYRLK